MVGYGLEWMLKKSRGAWYLAEGVLSDHGVGLGEVGARGSRAGREGCLLLQPLFNLLVFREFAVNISQS